MTGEARVRHRGHAPSAPSANAGSMRLLVALGLAVLCSAGCGNESGGGPARADAGPAGTSDAATAADAPLGPDAAPKPYATSSCVELRGCVLECGADAACVAACVSMAPAPAQKLHEELQSCSRAQCAPDDLSCRCDQECFVPSACQDQAVECADNEEDPFCKRHC